MAAVANSPLNARDPQVETYQGAIATTFYQGSFVGFSAGTKLVRPLVAGDVFAGIVEKVGTAYADSPTKPIAVVIDGAVEIPYSAAALTDILKDVYASDSNTVTFTGSTNSYVGHVRNVIVGQSLIVELAKTHSAIASLTTSVGTASDTIADVGSSFNQTTLNNIVASLATKVNELVRLYKGAL